VLVTANVDQDPYRNLILSRERDVLFVAINGQPFYGTTALMEAAGATRAEPIEVGSLRRSIVLVYPDVKDADMGWGEVLDDLELAVKDPVKRYLEIEKLHKAGKPPGWLMTDKPWDDPAVTGKPVPVDVRIPPLDPLSHDAAFLAAVKASPLHGGLLDGLADYYR
jgi:5-methylthioadenosine/S-adenosylhomocysteine deaminase